MVGAERRLQHVLWMFNCCQGWSLINHRWLVSGTAYCCHEMKQHKKWWAVSWEACLFLLSGTHVCCQALASSSKCNGGVKLRVFGQNQQIRRPHYMTWTRKTIQEVEKSSHILYLHRYNCLLLLVFTMELLSWYKKLYNEDKVKVSAFSYVQSMLFYINTVLYPMLDRV